MDKILSLLYLTLVSWWFLAFLLKFTYQKHITYYLGIIFFTASLFHGISLNIHWLKLSSEEFNPLMHWSTSLLAISCFYCFILQHLSSIPNAKKLNIISKILLLGFFLGLTKPLLEYQSAIYVFSLITLAMISLKFKNCFRLTFYPLMIGLSLLVTYIVLKMFGYDIMFLNLIALYYLKKCVDHFNIAAIGELKLV